MVYYPTSVRQALRPLSVSPPCLFEHTCDVCGTGAGREGPQARPGPPAQVSPLPPDTPRRRDPVTGWKKTIKRATHQHHRTLDPLSPPSRLSYSARAASLSTRLTLVRRELRHARARCARPFRLRGGFGGRERGAGDAAATPTPAATPPRRRRPTRRPRRRSPAPSPTPRPRPPHAGSIAAAVPATAIACGVGMLVAGCGTRSRCAGRGARRLDAARA